MVLVSLTNMTLAGVLVLGLALFAVADASRAISSECPKGNPDGSIVQVPHETDCTKYYVCMGGQKVERECPIMDQNGNKLHFNPKLGLCDWPVNAGCQLYLRIIGKSSVAGMDKISTECPKIGSTNETVQLAHEFDCTKFYKCSNGKKYLKDCPIDQDGNRLHFNASLQVCDWPWNANCKLPVPIMSTPSFSSAVTIPTECPKIDSENHTVQLAHETDCTKYYMCGNGEKYLRECPLMDDKGNRLYFNASEQVCDWPWNVDCKQSQSIVEITSYAVNVDIPTECPSVDSGDHSVQLAHETDCTKYYMCSHGRKHLMNCPLTANGGRLYFNPISQVCDWPWNVDCESSTVSPSTTITTVAPPITTTEAPTTTTSTTTEAPTTTTTTTTEAPTTTTSTTTVAPTTTTTTTTEAPTTTTTTTTEAPTTTTSTTTEAPTTTTSTTTVAPTTTTSTTTEAPTTTTSTTTEAPTTTTTTEPELGCMGTCPNDDPPNKFTTMPHSDCTKWCRCDGNEFKVSNCPSDFYYSPTEHKCTPKEKSGCENADFPSRYRTTHKHDEALMNILGYNERFRL